MITVLVVSVPGNFVFRSIHSSLRESGTPTKALRTTPVRMFVNVFIAGTGTQSMWDVSHLLRRWVRQRARLRP